MYMQLRAGWLVWERWVGGGGVGNRGSKPPYLLCLTSLAPTHFLFCSWLPPCSLFSLQKFRHCCQILPLPILLVLPPLALSSPIPLLSPISARIPFPVLPQPVNMRHQKWLEFTKLGHYSALSWAFKPSSLQKQWCKNNILP